MPSVGRPSRLTRARGRLSARVLLEEGAEFERFARSCRWYQWRRRRDLDRRARQLLGDGERMAESFGGADPLEDL